MQWFVPTSRIVALVTGGTLLGWYFGYPLAGATLALLAVVIFWSYQMSRLQQWLQAPDAPPDDIYGVWGEIIAHIHRHQRAAAKDQKRLQSTVDYLLESFASMRDGVVIVERQGGIRWCNDVATRLLGLRYPQDTGQAITNLVRHPDFNQYVAEQRYAEPLYIDIDGEQKLHLQVIITRFGEGDSLLFVRDVTERIRMEQMRRDFVANVSHELRTPLTVISGYLDNFLADSQRLPAPYVKPVKQMAQQAQRMETLLKDLLWLSRIESEGRREKLESISMVALLEELKDELSATQPQRCVQLDVQCQQKISGDYREIYSAVSNLVQNALNYSADDKPVVISWLEQDDDCLLSVIDQGQGIDPVHIPRLTERFYRVDDSRSSATGGTGLGLAIVKHVAASHDVRLTIESVLGKGSTFSLVFSKVGENSQAYTQE